MPHVVDARAMRQGIWPINSMKSTSCGDPIVPLTVDRLVSSVVAFTTEEMDEDFISRRADYRAHQQQRQWQSAALLVMLLGALNAHIWHLPLAVGGVDLLVLSTAIITAVYACIGFGATLVVALLSVGLPFMLKHRKPDEVARFMMVLRQKSERFQVSYPEMVVGMIWVMLIAANGEPILATTVFMITFGTTALMSLIASIIPPIMDRRTNVQVLGG